MKVGDIHNSPLLITEKDEQIFMDLTGDVNPIHWDADVAKKEGYSSPIVHGMLAASMIGKEIGMYFPGKGTINMERSFQFIRPLFVGKEYTISLKLTEIDVENHCGVIKFSIKDIDNKICLRGLTRVRNTIQFV